ncbi:SDR family NAD(P)-dependent oxidoreductase [Labrys wisconsinensis]|uniref:3-oxoacyl-[acyl-carrier protein] reductase n=1 Tax=Labrys wisconsinensis TaxID=425677 RepID=A0ABU0J0A5_9HYPH|nr:SDR family NAD(P)-dependent oxidoreductase [Labrys wisconsinensis]MDQ0467690.1 3-oxoacyl-[acyl-carrier protein] reductase [Labrys wisconsinensis]
MSQDLAGQTAVITGGVRGIGLGVGLHLAGRGCAVALWDVDPDGFDPDAAGFAPALVERVDVADEGAVTRAARAAEARLGHVDILVNNAGINGPVRPVADYPLREWERVLAIDLTGVFLCCRALVPGMVGRGYGRIVNVASIAGKEGTPGVSAYCAAKAGVIGFTKALAREVVTAGVTVNAVTPVMAETAILAEMTPEHIALTKAKIPMGRLVTVEEIAATIGWAASPACSFTTGAVFDISGGRADY